jgi:hypothetical protein
MEDKPPGTTSWADLGPLNDAADNTEGRVQDLMRYQSWRIPRDASLIVWQHIIGYLRGVQNVPIPVPVDLDGVAFSAALRVCDLITDYKDVQIGASAQVQTSGAMRVWLGFTLQERLILNRYRRTTA